MATVCCCNVIKMDFEDKISNFMTKIIIQLFVLKYMFSITKDQNIRCEDIYYLKRNERVQTQTLPISQLVPEQPGKHKQVYPVPVGLF